MIFMQKVVITGGTGLIGSALTKELLAKGYQVVILTRKETVKSDQAALSFSYWNIEQGVVDEDLIAEADYIVHLAGAGVAEKRWTKARKTEIVDSRVKSASLLCQVLHKNRLRLNLKSFISASAIGWYGADAHNPNPKPFTETAPKSDDYLGTTCFQWEQSVQPIVDLGKRLVILRTGIVLSKEGGALSAFEKPLQYGFAAILGSGRQMVSWIHIEDLLRLYITAMTNNNWQGIYNAVAPAPVNNKTLTLEIAKRVKGRYFTTLHVPEFVLKVVLGEMSNEVLKSATVSSGKIHDMGFVFQYPTVSAALSQLLKK